MLEAIQICASQRKGTTSGTLLISSKELAFIAR